jgi:Flp pilus assembly protein TadD
MGEDPLPALHQAMREAPRAPGPRLVLARRLLERGEEAGAQPLLENLAREGVAEAAFLLGVCHTRRGDYQGALERMRQAQRLNPHHEPTNQQVEALQRALAAEV